MNVRSATRELALVEVTQHRPRRRAYHSYVQMMNGNAQRTAQQSGWSVVRVAAADVGPLKLLQLTDKADAVVILGGEDIAPHYYQGENGYIEEGDHFESADEGQLSLVQRAAHRGTPLLGVCRGHQIINVALGGNIHQHLESDGTIHKNIKVPVHKSMTDHEVSLHRDSSLSAALGGVEVKVRSAHHQAVNTLGSGLRAVAHAADGVVEAIEHRTLPITGVQWHPEDPGAPTGQLHRFIGLLSHGASAVAA